MRFRLYYEGILRPTGRDPIGFQSDPLAAHKQEIRKCFHIQLQQLWRTNRFLREHKVDAKVWTTRPVGDEKSYWGGGETRVPMVDVIATRYREFGYRFVPLVIESYSLLCSLNILFLRRDAPGSVLTAGDIDNRLKTLIDALRRPRNASELAGHEIPAAGEDPFFCLLEDDKQVTHLEVETDVLLDPPQNGEADIQRARLIVTVEVRPYDVTLFNLSFS